MRIKLIINYSILILFLIGIFGSSDLVWDEILTGDGCPKIMHIPMCLVILICFIIPLIAHLSRKWNVLYFIFTGLAGSIALIASVMQFTQNGQCPKTDSGIPMCYYSLLIFSSLFILKIIYIKYNNQRQVI